MRFVNRTTKRNSHKNHKKKATTGENEELLEL